MAKITTLQLLNPLKVFLEFDAQYEIYVAQCLQTGHLVTADSSEMAKEMITELLTDEVSEAVRTGDLGKLLAHPAPMEKWIKCEMAFKANGEEEIIIRVQGEVAQEIRLLLGLAEVETVVKIATGRTAAA